MRNDKGKVFGISFRDVQNIFSAPEVIRHEIQQRKDIDKLNQETALFSTPINELSPFAGMENES